MLEISLSTWMMHSKQHIMTATWFRSSSPPFLHSLIPDRHVEAKCSFSMTTCLQSFLLLSRKSVVNIHFYCNWNIWWVFSSWNWQRRASCKLFKGMSVMCLLITLNCSLLQAITQLINYASVKLNARLQC